MLAVALDATAVVRHYTLAAICMAAFASSLASANQYSRHTPSVHPLIRTAHQSNSPVANHGMVAINNVPHLSEGRSLVRRSTSSAYHPNIKPLATIKRPSSIVGYAGRDVAASNQDDWYFATGAASRPFYSRAAVDPVVAAAAERRRRYAVQLIRNARNKRQGYGAPAPPTSVGPVYTFARTDTAGNYKWGVRHSIP